MADKKGAASGNDAQFVNDGSFMEKFKKLQEDSEEKKKKELEIERSEHTGLPLFNPNSNWAAY